MLDEYTKAELIDIMVAYNDYVISFYETHDDGCPVSIYEFIDNDYEYWKGGE